MSRDTEYLYDDSMNNKQVLSDPQYKQQFNSKTRCTANDRVTRET